MDAAIGAVPPGYRLAISDEAFAFLKLQRGAISDLADDRTKWEEAFHASVMADYESMLPFLPQTCARVLDIGGGLGAIDILLHRHYGNHCGISILDGDTAPVMKRHAEPFSNMRVALEFQQANGVWPVSYCTAWRFEQKFDLIISLASWCFHYNPETYLEQVFAACHAETVLIIDVRRDYRIWHEMLLRRFEDAGVAMELKKAVRRVFRVRA